MLADRSPQLRLQARRFLGQLARLSAVRLFLGAQALLLCRAGLLIASAKLLRVRLLVREPYLVVVVSNDAAPAHGTAVHCALSGVVSTCARGLRLTSQWLHLCRIG